MYRYYVYGHYTDDGTLFYIGKGSGDRLNNNNRNSAHDRIANKRGCVSKIFIDGLLEYEALALEKDFIWHAEDIGFILTNQNLGDYSQPTMTDEDSLNFINFICARNKFNHNNTTHYSKEIIEIDLDDEIINREYEKTIYKIIENYTQLQIDLLSIILVNTIAYSFSNKISFSIKELSKILSIEENVLEKKLVSFYPNLDLEVKIIKKYSRYPIFKSITLHDDCYEVSLFSYYKDLLIVAFNKIHPYTSDKIGIYLNNIVNLYNTHIEVTSKI